MKDQTNKEPLESLPGKLPVTAGRSGTASAQHVEKQGAGSVDPDAFFEWIRRRVRLSHWKPWKRPRARRRNLIKLGIALSEVYRASRSRNPATSTRLGAFVGFIRGGGQFRLVRCAARQQGIDRSPLGVPRLLRV